MIHCFTHYIFLFKLFEIIQSYNCSLKPIQFKFNLFLYYILIKLCILIFKCINIFVFYL
uniref:Uncharacterized protein n=1 Tax=Physcomitrium patens TaxID=3218 RepID=A0A2K1JBT1_PHYPA|nr:hypothetical protein PHYPA_019245 [Physcomitrium patens]